MFRNAITVLMFSADIYAHVRRLLQQQPLVQSILPNTFSCGKPVVQPPRRFLCLPLQECLSGTVKCPFCDFQQCRHFFTAIFAAESGSVSVVRSGLNASTISGTCHPCFCQTERILGNPLPARSPTFIRLNILMSDSFRGSDTPPTRASCTLIRKATGLAIRILSSRRGA